MKHTTFALAFAVAVFSFSACVSVADAREGGAQRECRWEDRCGNVGSGKRYAAFDECLTDKRASYLNRLPTERCDGKINGQALDVCFKAIENTSCTDLLDQLATFSKCDSGSICTASSGTGCSSCGQGQTCCSNSCVNLQTDRNNCGACGTSCGASVSCQSGVCR